MPSTTTKKIRELIEKLREYQEEVQWTERDPDVIKRTEATQRVEDARKRMSKLEPSITTLFKSILGDVAGIEEKQIQARRLEQNKVDQELKRILQTGIGEEVVAPMSKIVQKEIITLRRQIEANSKAIATQTSKTMQEEITVLKRQLNTNSEEVAGDYAMLYTALKKTTGSSDSVALKSIPSKLNSLRVALKFVKEKLTKIDLGEAVIKDAMVKLTELKDVLQIMNEEQEIWDIIYPATGEKKSVGAGTLTIDFYTGEVTLTDGTKEHTSRRLENSKYGKVKSLSVETDQIVTIELDSGGKYVTGADQLFSTPRQPFRTAYITCTATTSLKVYASTAEGIPVHSQNVAVDRSRFRYFFPSLLQSSLRLDSAGSSDVSLPSVTIPSSALPAGHTIDKVFCHLKYGSRNDSSGADNAIDGTQYIQVKESAAGAYVNAITIVDGTLPIDISETTVMGGDVVYGTTDVVAQVAAEDKTYNFQWLNSKVLGDYLYLKDIQMIIEVRWH